MSDFPFEETVIEENNKFIEVIREFSGDLNSEELNWHRDREHRLVKTISGDGWFLQIENKLPVEMTANSSFYIKKNVWHRIINKNRKNLIISVRKFK